MSMKLAKNNIPAYDYYSEDATDPVTAEVVLDGTGGTVTAQSKNPVYVIFENDTGGIDNIGGTTENPAGPLVQLTSEEVGIDWEVSLDDITYANEITLPSPQNVSAGDQAVLIYARCNVTNDGSVTTNNYVAAKIRTLAQQNPAA